MSRLHREAEEVGCDGLVGGTAQNLYTHSPCDAQFSTKVDGPFYCSSCKSEAVLRKCTEKAHHFAHTARLTPVLGPLESALHRSCKQEIRDALADRHPDGRWEMERPIPAKPSHGIAELRPDISGRISEQRVAIEVQASALTPTKIVARSMAYAQRGIALLWIIPLREALGTEPFRPRLYERYIHSIYFGRSYYWWPGSGLTLFPVHYGPASRSVEYREWREDGEDCSGGGYEVEYKIIKRPIVGPRLSLDKDFEPYGREKFVPENERKEIPACIVWRDKFPPWWTP